ncbi:hypothetical protein GN156_26375, partial [bacterium LRH843]|nr:hypothetical protein [bacterium LRH843]
YNGLRQTYSRDLVDKLISKHGAVCKSIDIPDEMLYGRAGYLYALLFIKKHTDIAIDDTVIRKVITAILASGQDLAEKRGSEVPLEYEWHGKNY